DRGTHRPGPPPGPPRPAGRARHRRAGRHRRVLPAQGHGDDHARPGVHEHRVVPVGDHLHRRRRGDPALPRLPDRAAGRVVQLPRGQPPADPRRAAHGRRAGGVHLADQPAHAAARGPDAVLRRLPARRAPDARAVVGGLDAVDLLPGRAEPPRRRAGGALDVPAAGQAADDRGVRLQEERRAAVPLPRQLPRPGRELPADDVRVPRRAVPGRPRDGQGPRPAAGAARRPRAELLDVDGADGGLLGGEPVRLDLGGHPRAVRSGARRGELGGAGDARGHPPRRRRRRLVHAQGQGQDPGRAADGLRAPGLQELRPAGGAGEGDRRPDAREVGAERAARHRQAPRADRALRRLLRGAEALPERRLLHRADLPGHGLPDADVHRAVRPGAAAGVDRPVARDGGRPADEDQPAAPGLHRGRRARLRAARPAL
ncbi:MAG: Citrate synthase (si), partial [uncultured Quadrisphaera sp.]